MCVHIEAGFCSRELNQLNIQMLTYSRGVQLKAFKGTRKFLLAILKWWFLLRLEK